MDPHQLNQHAPVQNNVGVPQNNQLHQAAVLQQSYQLLAQQQPYFSQLCQNPQMLQMDSAALFPNPQLFLGMHNAAAQQQQQQQQQQTAAFYQHQQQMLLQQHFQQQQQQEQQRLLAEHAAATLQQQHLQQQQAQAQQQAQQQQQERETAIRLQEANLKQQKMLEQQNRQMATHRAEIERQLREQQLLRQIQQKEENMRRQAALELQRKEEEAARKLAEEEERRRQEEEKRQEQLRKIKLEEERRERELQDAFNEMKRRANATAKPLSLAATTYLTRMTLLVPFPSENRACSSFSSLMEPATMESQLSLSCDEDQLNLIASVLKNIEVNDIVLRGESGEEDASGEGSSGDPSGKGANREGGSGDSSDALPHFLASLHSAHPHSLSVDEEIQNLLTAFSDHTEGDAEDHHDQMPSTSNAASAEERREERTTGLANNQSVTSQPPRDEAALRKIISLGKQPKAHNNNNRKKKDMVESLYDSLTDYFDPSRGRRRRQRTKTYEEEQVEKREVELVAEMEARAADREDEDETQREETKEKKETPEGQFFERKEKKEKERHERAPTPVEDIKLREAEWAERERIRNEKRRKRDHQEGWSSDVRVQSEALSRCIAMVDHIVESVDLDPTEADGEDEEISPEMLIDKQILRELRTEVQKLKMYKKMNEVPSDRLIKLLTILERNIRDVLCTEGGAPLVPISDEDAGDEEADTLRELVDDRLERAADASCVALLTMTSAKMPKQVFLEDTIERAVQLCKQYLNYIIYPASDVCLAGRRKAFEEPSKAKRRRFNGEIRTPIVQRLYTRVLELLTCFAELARSQSLPEGFNHQLSTASLSSFFVANVPELQLKAMSVLSNIFARSEEMTRQGILNDLLNSLHRLPSTRSSVSSYRNTDGQHITIVCCLFMQLIQSVIKIPKRRKQSSEEEDDYDEGGKDYSKEDALVRESYTEAKTLTTKFLMGLLNKCAQRSEDDYRRILDWFVSDITHSLMKPEWPVAELILAQLAVILSNLYSNRQSKSVDLSLRQLSLEYLGTICARLRMERKETPEEGLARLQNVVKSMVYFETDDPTLSADDIDLSDKSVTELLKIAEQGLLDFLIQSKIDNELSVEYAIKFYVAEWYRTTLEDLEMMKDRMKKARDAADTEKEKRKQERKWEKSQEKGGFMKSFLICLADKKHLKKRSELLQRTNSWMLSSDAMWLIKYLSHQRDLCNSFDTYLKQILLGVTTEQAVGLRTKAMKSLTQIIEVDQGVLGIMDVRRAVHTRMTDPNAQVREATIDLLGKFLMNKPDLIEDYYPIFIERIKDSGTSVRKRVIRIIRDYCAEKPGYVKVPEMLSRIVRRVTDEEGVKKLVVDTFSSLWFQLARNRQQVLTKVHTLTKVVGICMKEGGLEYVESVLGVILKTEDKGTTFAAMEIVDTLVDSIIEIEKLATEKAGGQSAIGQGESWEDEASRVEQTQHALLSSLTTLSLFSKVRPDMLIRHAEMLQPYLSMNTRSENEQKVLNQVIQMLERILPLMDHPSNEFVAKMDYELAMIAKNSSQMVIIESAISCASALYSRSPRYKPACSETFIFYLRNLKVMKVRLEKDPGFVIQASHMAVLQRSLFSIGLMTRFFDWDTILESETSSFIFSLNFAFPSKSEESNADDREKRKVRDNVYSILFFFSKYREDSLRQKAFASLGHVCAEYPEYYELDETKKVFGYFLNSKEQIHMLMKINALKNIDLFLTTQEKKMIKSNQEWQKAKETQDLKEMELAGSGLCSAIIQMYWLMVLQSYYHTNDDVRIAAMQVVWGTLSQGLVTPGSSIAVLIAMSTDSLLVIRNKVEGLIKDIDSKYQGMVQNKTVQGVREAYRIQRIIKGEEGLVRGIRVLEQSATNNTVGRTILMLEGAPKWSNDGQSLLSGLYQSLRGGRTQRRAVLSSCLALFSDNYREQLTIEEWIFVADNIAMFPYQVLDEPLFVIHKIDAIVALSGQSIINQFKAQLQPLPPSCALPEDDDVEFEPTSLYERLPEDKSVLYELMRTSQACFTLLYLKAFLIKLYNLTEAKVGEYSPSDAAKLYDKAVSRRNVPIFTPFTALSQLRPEVKAQRNTPEGHWQLVQHLAQFRRMLLSMDKMEEDEEGGEEAEKREDEEGDGERDAEETSGKQDDE